MNLHWDFLTGTREDYAEGALRYGSFLKALGWGCLFVLIQDLPLLLYLYLRHHEGDTESRSQFRISWSGTNKVSIIEHRESEWWLVSVCLRGWWKFMRLLSASSIDEVPSILPALNCSTCLCCLFSLLCSSHMSLSERFLEEKCEMDLFFSLFVVVGVINVTSESLCVEPLANQLCQNVIFLWQELVLWNW